MTQPFIRTPNISDEGPPWQPQCNFTSLRKPNFCLRRSHILRYSRLEFPAYEFGRDTVPLLTLLYSPLVHVTWSESSYLQDWAHSLCSINVFHPPRLCSRSHSFFKGTNAHPNTSMEIKDLCILAPLQHSFTGFWKGLLHPQLWSLQDGKVLCCALPNQKISSCILSTDNNNREAEKKKKGKML